MNGRFVQAVMIKGNSMLSKAFSMISNNDDDGILVCRFEDFSKVSIHSFNGIIITLGGEFIFFCRTVVGFMDSPVMQEEKIWFFLVFIISDEFKSLGGCFGIFGISVKASEEAAKGFSVVYFFEEWFEMKSIKETQHLIELSFSLGAINL